MADLKQTLLNAGFELISEHGFAGIGIMKIIQQAKATKGSFYHHFKSKEDFGRQLLEDYFENHLNTLNHYLEDSSIPFEQRAIHYFEFWSESKVTEDFQIKCLVVKLSGEISGTSSSMQAELDNGANKVISRMTDYFVSGNEQELLDIETPHMASRTLYAKWLGATLLCAIQKDRTHLEQAMTETKTLIK
ncbi:TetR/AcrR family transcriptional regulator [Vibrio methylphosphonaticus]|uniref:TetR/AcrR family transcriptional regulator n=1 Tax=Vibrio methylphosphonaticus TaxID=2946866 RepID=UPI00202A95B6|nr:TetR/AcrR family transcriptional regulator [Vibrio methylphosphonaticus]MCL9775870.1 TetR/AcrR family transcriptional regulator [Vibrio methylphosphonaticus]